MKCRNCGHEIAKYRDRWYHASEDPDGSVNLTVKCEFSLENEDTERFEEEEMRRIDGIIRNKFGDKYQSECLLFDISCTCNNPEPDSENGKWYL